MCVNARLLTNVAGILLCPRASAKDLWIRPRTHVLDLWVTPRTNETDLWLRPGTNVASAWLWPRIKCSGGPALSWRTYGCGLAANGFDFTVHGYESLLSVCEFAVNVRECDENMR